MEALGVAASDTAVVKLSAEAASLALNVDLRTMLDRLPFAEGAPFDHRVKEHNPACYPNTCVEILEQMSKWLDDPSGKTIFWLNSMSGTGKSTISRTFARSQSNAGRLGASFFFRLGDSDRGNMIKFMTTITHQLVERKPNLAPVIKEVLEANPALPRSTTQEQFMKLIFEPLSRVVQTVPIVIIIDALDECENDKDIRLLINCFSHAQSLQSCRLRVFITSRPELPIRLGFKNVENADQDLSLHEMPPYMIEHDISAFIEHELGKIRDDYNASTRNERKLSPEWPGQSDTKALVDRTTPLFIVAATACQFISERQYGAPDEQLKKILQYKGPSASPQLDRIYMPILDQQFAFPWTRERDEVGQQFRHIFGALIILKTPLSVPALAQLLGVSQATIKRTLDPLHSVLATPFSPDCPVRLIHQSFRDFLLDPALLYTNPLLWIDGKQTHQEAAEHCLRIMTKSLRRNICGIETPETHYSAIDIQTIHACLPPEIQYACLHWVFHLRQATTQLSDGGHVHDFLTRHFFHWIEALSLLGVVSKTIGLLGELQDILHIDNSVALSKFLDDATRLILVGDLIISSAPLQTYSSIHIFAPRRSMIRQMFGTEFPSWLSRQDREAKENHVKELPDHKDMVNSVAFSSDSALVSSASYDLTVRIWLTETGTCLQTLRGHTDWVSSVAFSHDSNLVMSGSADETIRFWRIDTGECLQILRGHSNWVSSVAFSHDSAVMMSGSADQTIRIWRTNTGECLRTLRGHSDWVSSVTFSHDSELVVSGSVDQTIRIWRTNTGECLRTLRGHSDWVSSVTFSHDSELVVSGSADKTIRIWRAQTGECLQILRGHSDWVSSVTLSHDSARIASGSGDGIIRIWRTDTSGCVQKLRGHTDSVTSVAFSHDSRLIVSASDDNSIRIWHTAVDDPQLPMLAISRDSQSEISDISDVSTIFTHATNTTAYSSSSLEGFDPQQAAAKTLAHHLYSDSDLHQLYSQAVQEYGTTRFSDNHDRLLKIFMKDLRRATTDPRVHLAIKVIGKRQSRVLVTAHVLRLLQMESNPSSEHRVSMQRLLDQQEDRNYSLNLLLYSQQSGSSEAKEDLEPHSLGFGRAISGPSPKEVELEESDEDDEDEEDEEDDDNQDRQPAKSGDLAGLVEFLTTGSPFRSFRSNLACFTHPPTTISAALGFKNSRALKKLFRRHFDDVAQGEYAWIRDLENLGHTRDEIAELLLEDSSDSPWIFFAQEEERNPQADVQLQHHLPGCVHQLPWFHHHQDVYVNSATGACVTEDSSSVLATVQRLCGLAGIAPSTRDLEKWNGSVMFEDESSVALVSYAHPDIGRIASRVANALELFCSALSWSQSAGLCCESFTILRQTPNVAGEQKWEDSMVELCRVEFSLALQMLENVRLFAADLNICNVDIPMASKLLKHLCPALESLELFEDSEPLAILHIYSLSTQIMTMGFQLYMQGHVGAFHPFLLDTPLKRVRLLGCQVAPGRYPSVELRLEELTCVGEMLRGPVLVFRVLPSAVDTFPYESLPEPAKFDLSASSEDFIDTWGPGQFVMPSGHDGFPSAIRICGGILHLTDPGTSKFHWSRDDSPEKFCQGELNPVAKMRIGAPVTINNICDLNEGRCRARYAGFLRPLGPHPPGWSLAKKQVGVQAGMHTLIQANAAYHKYPGRTLKQFRLEQRDEDLVSFLEDHWAVQVSLCTGVARRVPLREMIADLLPVFADNITLRDDFINWESLRSDHAIFGAFQCGNLKDWLRNLAKPLHHLVLQIIRRILHSLRETGLDRQGKSLLVSWPYKNDTHQCFEIDLTEHETSWARLIADSEDCATFAYVSSRCLETTEVRCRGAESSWRNAIPLLETVVMVCPTYHTLQAPLVIASALRHNETYYFRKLDSVLFVRVEKPDAAAVAKLVQKPSNIPDRVKHRLFARAQRLRERRGMQETGEQVSVLTSITS